MLETQFRKRMFQTIPSSKEVNKDAEGAVRVLANCKRACWTSCYDNGGAAYIYRDWVYGLIVKALERQALAITCN